MNKHKSKALEDGCLCSDCKFKFQCFTQERIFSDPIFQGLFEALMAQGYSKEDALELVANEIKARIPFAQQPQPIAPYPYTTGGAAGWDSTIITVDNDIVSSDYTITYTMLDGKEVSWNASYDGGYKN